MADDQDLAEADTAPVSMLERHPLRDADDQLRPDFVALISGAVQRDVRAMCGAW